MTTAFLVYKPPSKMEDGLKLRSPWIRLYCVDERLSPISYVLSPEVDKRVARAYVNRLRKLDQDVRETEDPRDGVVPDKTKTHPVYIQ